MKHKAVIIGAGALGLGYIAERLADDYELCLADVSSRRSLLDSICKVGFMVNICGLDGIVKRKVEGQFSSAVTDTSEDRKQFYEALIDADIVLTVTGRRVLDKLIADIAPAMNARNRKGWLLFCENGLDIASEFASSFNYMSTLVDTVMSRMCRFTRPEETAYAPLLPGHNISLAVEEYSYFPVKVSLCSPGPFSKVFSMVTPEEFDCWEDIKLYMHNGMHAFVSYHAWLEGVRFFPETPQSIRDQAEEVMQKEVAQAVINTHPSVDPARIKDYGLQLLERFFNPFFNDSIERGIRGIEEKLAPGERLLGGCEYIKRAGIEPKGYATTIDAAKKIISMKS